MCGLHAVSVSSPSIEASALACTSLPLAAVARVFLRLDMGVIHMVNQVLQGIKETVTLEKDKSHAIHYSAYRAKSIA